MSGYCEVGRVSIETVPMITVRMAMTMATMGRRIKNLDMGQGLAVCCLAGTERGRFGRDSCGATGTPSLSFCRLSVITIAPASSPLSTIQSLPNCGPSFDVDDVHPVIRADNVHLLDALQFLDSDLRNQNRAAADLGRRGDRPNWPGRKRPPGLGKTAAMRIAPVC